MELTHIHRFSCEYCFWNHTVFVICTTMIIITILICMSVIWVTYLRNKNDQQKHESQLIEAEKTRLACSCSVGVLQGGCI